MIAKVISEKTGKKRTAQQVRSYIQTLVRKHGSQKCGEMGVVDPVAFAMSKEKRDKKKRDEAATTEPLANDGDANTAATEAAAAVLDPALLSVERQLASGSTPRVASGTPTTTATTVTIPTPLQSLAVKSPPQPPHLHIQLEEIYAFMHTINVRRIP